MINFNQSIHASPMATRTMDSIEAMYQNNQGVVSRLAAFGSMVSVAGDAAFVHAPLAVAKAVVATTFKTAETAAALFGKDININDKCLSHFTGSEAMNHAGKILGAVIVMASAIIGLIRPDFTVAVSRALGTSRTPEAVKEEPKARMQKVRKAITNKTQLFSDATKPVFQKIGNGINAGMTPVRNHPRLAIAALAAAVVGAGAAAEYQFGIVQNSGVLDIFTKEKDKISDFPKPQASKSPQPTVYEFKKNQPQLQLF